jgi:xylan 1,4-beta-xylosidase
MIAHATQNDVPLDFVSTHVYGNDSSKDVFGDDRTIAPHQMVCAAVAKVHSQIKNSSRPDLPLIWSEFNATYMNQSEVTDSIYMGPWLADTIRQCDGLVDLMSYWTFSDVFEEQGPVKTPFYGGYGLIAEDAIPKPAFDAFELLHALGETRIAEPQDDVLVTRRKDGALVVAAWNLVEPGAAGAEKTIKLQLRAVKPGAHATVRRVDAQHGDTLAAFEHMGRPRYPTQLQIQKLREASKTGPAEPLPVSENTITVKLPPSGLAVIEIH